MTLSVEEVGDLLATAAAFDSRTVGKGDLLAWSKAIGDLDYADASQAIIDHYTETTDWLKPAHVRARVKQIRRARLVNADRVLPAAHPDAKDYKQQFQNHLKALADGKSVGLALTTGARRTSGPTSEYAAARGTEYARRRAALSVPCPVQVCAMEAGRPCRAIGSRRDLPSGFHTDRLHSAIRVLSAQGQDLPAGEEFEDRQYPAPAVPVSSTPWCGQCHDESRTKNVLTADRSGLERVPCPTCGPGTSRKEFTHDRD